MARKIHHLTPRYLKNKIALVVDEFRFPDNPWLTKEAVNLLDRLLTQRDRGVEFGSGRSTVWFARRLSHLISIEDNAEWFELVGKTLTQEKHFGKVDYRFAPSTESYLGVITELEPESIDFCLIDGRDRDLCAVAMIEKIRRGGILVIDNANWFLPNDKTYSPSSVRSNQAFPTESWHEFHRKTLSWRRIWTSNGVTDTCLFFKP